MADKIIAHSDKVNFKRIKFERGVTNLNVGDTIRFKYGITSLSNMIGVITHMYDNGVSCNTDCGFFNPAWNRITSVWVPKNILDFKFTRVNVENHSENLPLFDGILNTIKSKFHLYQDNITDERVDLSTKFRRILKFRKGHKWISISIEDENVDKLTVIECLNKSETKHKIRVDREHKNGANKIIKTIEGLFGIKEDKDEDEKVKPKEVSTTPSVPRISSGKKGKSASPCKQAIYDMWLKGEKDIKVLEKLKDPDTKLTTITTWMYDWKFGRNTPKGVS